MVKRFSWLGRVVTLASVCSLSVACSGGGSSTSSSGGATVTAESLTSVTNLPDFNLDNLDAATTANASLNRRLTKFVEDTEQEFSRAGCEARAQVEELKYQLKDMRGNVCIVKEMEENAGMEVGNGEYEYYEMTFEEGEAPADGDTEIMPAFSARVRVGVIDEQLRMDLCTGQGESPQTQEMALTFGVAEGQFDGVIKNRYPSYLDEGSFDTFSLEAQLASDNPEEFAVGDTASFLAQMNTLWGSGSISLLVEKQASEVIRNTVAAAFRSGNESSEWGTWTTQTYGIYDNNEGCATWAASGSFPAMTVQDFFPDSETQAEIQTELSLDPSEQFCWKQIEEEICNEETPCSVTDFIEPAVDGECSFEDSGNTECFSLELSELGQLAYYTLDSSEMEDSDIFDDVDSNSELSEFTAPTIAFEGDEVWDCEAPEGTTFQEIDTANMNSIFEDCFTISEDSGRGMESCYDREQEEQASDDLEVEFEEEEIEFGTVDEEGEEEEFDEDEEV